MTSSKTGTSPGARRDGEGLDVAVTRRGTTVILELSGELDLHDVPRLREALAGALADDTGAVVVDLTAVGFIDSSGLSTLLNGQRRLTRAGRRLVLVVADGPVQRVLRLTRLDTTFTVVRSVGAALAGAEARAAA